MKPRIATKQVAFVTSTNAKINKGLRNLIVFKQFNGLRFHYLSLLVGLLIFTQSCTQHQCPAYARHNVKKQNINVMLK